MSTTDLLLLAILIEMWGAREVSIAIASLAFIFLGIELHVARKWKALEKR